MNKTFLAWINDGWRPVINITPRIHVTYRWGKKNVTKLIDLHELYELRDFSVSLPDRVRNLANILEEQDESGETT